MKKQNIKLKLTISVEYDADPDHYDTQDPFKMADIDQANFRQHIEDAFELLETKGAKINVDVVSYTVPKLNATVVPFKKH